MTCSVRVPKSKHGGAYLMVLTATMLMLILVAIVLAVTAVSRRLTAFYSYNYGLYDLAVSGNEQALFLLEQEWESRINAAKLRALTQIVGEGTEISYNGGFRISPSYKAIFQTAFINGAMHDLQGIMNGIFPSDEIAFSWIVPRGQPPRTENHTWSIHNWDMSLSIETIEREINNFYRARTTLRPYGANDRFQIRTNIRRYTDGTHGVPVEVEATIIWRRTGYREVVLDAHTIFMLELIGVVFTPFEPAPGSIIFLDEFALTMVESWRSDISQRSDPWRS